MTAQVVILGAGRPFTGESHSALRAVNRRGSVLDWLLAAFAPLRAEVHFVGGYGIADVMERFPRLRYVTNPDWRTTGSMRSLADVGLGSGEHDVYISYADILFRPELVEALRATPPDRVSTAVDSVRIAAVRASREVVAVNADGEPVAFGRTAEMQRSTLDLIGVIRVPAGLVAQASFALEVALEASPSGHLAAWLEAMRRAGIGFALCDVSGQWTDLDSGASLARFVFGTKAETLARLAGVLTSAQIAPQVSFSVRDWDANRKGIVDHVLAELPPGALAVRSSALSEDGFTESNAGKFDSELHVAFAPDALAAAVDRVVASYDEGVGHQVLVQPMVRDVVRSGVAFTRTLGTGAPYRVINYSEGSRTDVVTSGSREASTVVYVHRGSDTLPARVHPSLAGVLAALDEIERLTELDTLDVEFAIDAQGVCHVLQVRPLVIENERTTEADRLIGVEIQRARTGFIGAQVPPPGLVGRRTIFGVMPDWNPAEIVGLTPDPLAESLYRHLITDETWAVQRAEFGYRDVRSQPLIHLFAGHPYVDVRASLNSFVPASLPDDCASRIVEAAIERLEANPKLHDKLEFSVTLTCRDLDFDAWMVRLSDAGLSRSEILDYRDAMSGITRHAFARCDDSMVALAPFAAMQDDLIGRTGLPLQRARSLLIACRLTGTLLFAHLARCGFVAMALLRSAVKTGVIEQARMDAFLASIRTVGHRLPADAFAVRQGKLGWDSFVQRYAHLRPGTYDIGSPSYSADPERYLRPLVESAHAPQMPDFVWTPEEARAWQGAMRAAGLPHAIEEIDRFLRQATEGREEAKFVFTKGVSVALDDIAAWATWAGLDREEVACLDIMEILAQAHVAVPDTDGLRRRAAHSRERMRLFRAMRLPPLLCNPLDLASFVMPEAEPNFITAGRVRAPIGRVDELSDTSALDGAIALIDNADPGYDWIFGRKLAGLITAFGGANSHMAIRAAEFGLPAAIGIGEVQMEALWRAQLVELDCAARRVLIIR
ncbi:MAG: PEP-utilizing enzyme [Alsobacter sp.]